MEFLKSRITHFNLIIFQKSQQLFTKRIGLQLLDIFNFTNFHDLLGDVFMCIQIIIIMQEEDRTRLYRLLKMIHQILLIILF